MKDIEKSDSVFLVNELREFKVFSNTTQGSGVSKDQKRFLPLRDQGGGSIKELSFMIQNLQKCLDKVGKAVRQDNRANKAQEDYIRLLEKNSKDKNYQEELLQKTVDYQKLEVLYQDIRQKYKRDFKQKEFDIQQLKETIEALKKKNQNAVARPSFHHLEESDYNSHSFIDQRYEQKPVEESVDLRSSLEAQQSYIQFLEKRLNNREDDY